MTRVWAAPLAVLLFYACLHAFVLPPDGFMAGDQGTKLLQTRATLAHGPFTPWIDGLSHDLDPELEYQEPFLLRRDDKGRLVGVFPWILPTVTAPFYWLFGLYGLYVVPAMATAITFIAALDLGRKLNTPAAGLSSAWSGVAATPVVFYGAEFWEHAPAVALTTIAVAIAAPGGRPAGVRRLVVVGAAIGAAAAFRPEAAVMLPAIVLALTVATGLRTAPRSALAVGAGFAIVTALILPVNMSVFGASIPQHVSSNLAAGWARYGLSRGEIVRDLLLPASSGMLFVGVVVIGGLLVSRASSAARVYGCHAIVLLLVLCGAGLPLWRVAAGVHPLAAFNITSLGHTWPFAFAGVYILALPTSESTRSIERYLLVTIVLFIACAVAIMPPTGRTQWGPRLLLPAAPLAGALVAGAFRRFELPSMQLTGVRLMAAGVIALSVAVQAFGLAVLAHHKSAHARIVRSTETLTKPGDVIVSDLYWFPELTSRLYSSRRLLYARSQDDVVEIASRAAETGFRRVNIVTSLSESSYQPPASLVTSNHVTFLQTNAHDIGVRNLRLFVYER